MNLSTKLKLVSVILPLCIGLLSYLFIPFEEFDSFRYYDNAKTFENYDDVFDFIQYYFSYKFDFIYYLLQYICIKLNLPLQILTGLSVGFLYVLVFQISLKIKNDFELNLNILTTSVLFFMFFSTSFITVWSISRNVTGLLFVSFGMKSLLDNNYFKGFLFFLLAVFTHVSLILYLMIFFLGYQFSGFLTHRKRNILVILFTCIVFISPEFISNIAKYSSLIFVINSEYDYLHYFELDYSSNIFFNDSLGWGDKSLILTSTFYYLFCLFKINSHRKIINGYAAICFWLVISLGMSQMYVQRTLLFLMPFSGFVGFLYLIENRRKSDQYIFFLICVIHFIAFIWNIYSYRKFFLFGLP